MSWLSILVLFLFFAGLILMVLGFSTKIPGILMAWGISWTIAIIIGVVADKFDLW